MRPKILFALGALALTVAGIVYVAAVFGPAVEGCSQFTLPGEGERAEGEHSVWPPGTDCHYYRRVGELTGVVELRWDWAAWTVGALALGAIGLAAAGFKRRRSLRSNQ